ncbi:hypothetical protein AVEN_228527-1 [Araneus ventricosus]|uniref:Secreted protein n=1 Tax=Araneus ventricosus TaxID=182803 RepID=A0A4Y2D937_ARAVE|nr:hypothetical protein AVEN_228527-1 [Araneus ventricosus]
MLIFYFFLLSSFELSTSSHCKKEKGTPYSKWFQNLVVRPSRTQVNLCQLILLNQLTVLALEVAGRGSGVVMFEEVLFFSEDISEEEEAPSEVVSGSSGCVMLVSSLPLKSKSVKIFGFVACISVHLNQFSAIFRRHACL